MTHSALASVLGSDFDRFLFAPLGEDVNDVPLSVLSALARLNIDPWEEAAELARLPGETATQRLTSLIAALPDRSSAHLDPGTIAARLIVLLPSRARSKIPLRGTLLGVGTTPSPVAIISVIFIYVFITVFMMSAQWIVASREPPAQVDSALAPASSNARPQMPSANAGQ